MSGKRKRHGFIAGLAMALAEKAHMHSTVAKFVHPLAHLRDDEQRIRLAAEKRERRKVRNGKWIESNLAVLKKHGSV